MANIITMDEASNFLGVEITPITQTSLQILLNAIDSSLFNSTGVHWNNPPIGQNIEPLAKSTALLMLWQMYFATDKYQTTITYNIKQLQLMQYSEE